MYNLEELLKTFKQHTINAKQNQKHIIKQFIENNPDENIPDHMIDDFILPEALASICHEILLVKKKLKNLAQKQHTKK